MKTEKEDLRFIMKWLHIKGSLVDERFESRHWRYIAQLIWCYIVRIYSLIFMVQMSHVYWNFKGLEYVSDNSSDMLSYIPTNVLVASFTFRGKDYKKLVKLIEKTYKTMKNNELFAKYMNISERSLRFCRRLTISYSLYTVTVGSLYAVTPIFRSGFKITENNRTIVYRPLAMDLWPNFQKIDPNYYVYDYIMQMVALIICCLETTSETLCFTLILFITSLFHILNKTTNGLKRSVLDDIEREINNKRIQIHPLIEETPTLDKIHLSKQIRNKLSLHFINRYEQCMVTIVKCHQELISEVKLLSELLSPLLFSHFLVSSVSLCMNGYTLNVSVNTDTPTIFARTFSTSLVLVRVGVYCYLGTRLTTKSEEAAFAAYSCDWHCDSSKKIKLSTQMMIQRAQKTLALTAGGFAVLSLRTYTSVIQAAYSYLTLLRKTSSF